MTIVRLDRGYDKLGEGGLQEAPRQGATTLIVLCSKYVLWYNSVQKQTSWHILLNLEK
jgi:hypothetical protein